MAVNYQLGQRISIGGRPSNQDRIASIERDDVLMFVLADGMGGYERGDLAASITVDTAVQLFEGLTYPAELDPNLFVVNAIYMAHIELVKKSRELNMGKRSPRTTAVLCIVQNGFAYWGHVGDSRLYHYRNGHMLVRTRDHTVNELRNDVRLTKFAHMPTDKRLLNSIGGDKRPHISLSGAIRMKRNDVLLTCSDGIWNHMQDHELFDLLCGPTIEVGLDQLFHEALKRGGERCDNMSAIVLHWMALEENLGPDMSTRIQAVDQSRLWDEIQANGPMVTRVDTPSEAQEVPENQDYQPEEEVDPHIKELEDLLSEIENKL